MGVHYFLIIVEDFSRGTWVYLIKYRSKVLNYLSMFINMIETQFNKRVKCVRYDNALEFISNQLKCYYKEKSIIFTNFLSLHILTKWGGGEKA